MLDVNLVFIYYFILFATKIKEKREKKRSDEKNLTETFGAYERLGLPELRVRAV